MFYDKYDTWFDEVRQLISQHLKSDILPVRKLVDYQQLSRGKMVRPLLVFLSSELVGNNSPDTLSAAAAMEVIHTATLLHDDVVDKAEKRHNRPTVNNVWDNKSAVLLGDYYLSQGLRLLLNTGKIAYVEAVMRCASELAQGELLQHINVFNTDVDTYLKIIEFKTASLFRACAYCGAISGGGNDTDVDNMSKFGILLGMIFQLKDDVLDYSPQYADKIGKPVLNDIVEGKITLPLLSSFAQADASECRAVMQLIKNAPQEVDKVLAFVKEYSGVEHANKVMKNYANQARGLLKEYETKNSRAYNDCMELLDFLLTREF